MAILAYVWMNAESSSVMADILIPAVTSGFMSPRSRFWDDDNDDSDGGDDGGGEK